MPMPLHQLKQLPEPLHPHLIVPIVKKFLEYRHIITIHIRNVGG